VVPPQDYEALYKAGAEAIFPPGTLISDAAEELIHKSTHGSAIARRRNSFVARNCFKGFLLRTAACRLARGIS